jgi:hypothetical protein
MKKKSLKRKLRRIRKKPRSRHLRRKPRLLNLRPVSFRRKVTKPSKLPPKRSKQLRHPRFRLRTARKMQRRLLSKLLLLSNRKKMMPMMKRKKRRIETFPRTMVSLPLRRVKLLSTKKKARSRLRQRPLMPKPLLM